MCLPHLFRDPGAAASPGVRRGGQRTGGTYRLLRAPTGGTERRRESFSREKPRQGRSAGRNTRKLLAPVAPPMCVLSACEGKASEAPRSPAVGCGQTPADGMCQTPPAAPRRPPQPPLGGSTHVRNAPDYGEPGGAVANSRQRCRGLLLQPLPWPASHSTGRSKPEEYRPFFSSFLGTERSDRDHPVRRFPYPCYIPPQTHTEPSARMSRQVSAGQMETPPSSNRSSEG